MSEGEGRARSAVLMLGSGRGLVLVLNFATTAYLLRVLGPVPFGLLAMAAAVLAFLNALGDAGVGASLVSEPELPPNRIAAALCLTAGLGLAVTAVALLATPLVLWLSGTRAILVPWLALVALVVPGVVGAVPAALAQRDERFALLAWAQAGSTVVACAAGIGLAQVRLDVWPLLARQALATGGILVILWVWVRPAWARPRRVDFAEISRFSAGMLGTKLLSVLHRQGDDLLVGQQLGERQLGYYNLCYRVLTVPLQQISGIAGTIAYPRLSKLAPDWAAVAEGLARVMSVVALLTGPFCIGLAAAAPEVIVVVFGAAWLPALVPLQVLALVGFWQAPLRLVDTAYVVRRETAALSRWSMLATPCYVASFAAGLPWGITGVAVSYAIVNLLLTPLQLHHASRILEQPRRILTRGALGGLLLGALAGLPLVAARELTLRVFALDAPAVLGATVATGALVELVIVVWLLRGRREEAA